MTTLDGTFENQLLRPSVFEIDLDAIDHNLREIQHSVGAAVRVFAVLKCNAYGFGLKEVGQVVEDSPVFGIAVGNLLEAVFLRKHGVTKPILVYANNLPSAADEVVRHGLMPTVQDLVTARAYARAARGGSLKVFVKVDVGLHRNGVLPEEAPAFCATVGKMAGLAIDGIYAHLDVQGLEEADYVEWQFGQFIGVLKRLEKAGLEIPNRMVAHSPIIPHYPHMDLNCVDPGKLVYGLYPTSRAQRTLWLKPAFRSLKTRIIAKKTLRTGTPFDNLARFPLRADTTIGILPLGWGDGFPKGPLNEGTVLVRGKRAQVLGELTVEHTRVCLSDIPESQVGDEVVIIGRQGNEEISMQEVADRCGLGLSELSRTIREPVARLFFKNGSPYKLATILGETCAEKMSVTDGTRKRRRERTRPAHKSGMTWN